MRSYSANILPTEGAYYLLLNASIQNGQLLMSAGGSASVPLNITNISALTEYFRVTAIASPFSDNYDVLLSATIRAKSITGKYFTYYCNLSADEGDSYSAEIEMVSEQYETLEFSIQSEVECTVFSWELCPQASDGDIQVTIDGVKQSLPKLLYDYNNCSVEVNTSEQVVGLISCYLQSNTDLQGHFTMNCIASERCTVHVRMLDNDMTELFSPLLFDINAGYNTIAIPHAYLHKLAGLHNFMVTAQTTNGILTVPVHGILYTIDGGYLAQRLMEPGMDIQDITIQKITGDREPTRIWAIGIENDVTVVRRRSYNPANYNEAWETMYTYDKMAHAAIEFDGTWEILENTSDNIYSMVTGEIPLVFMITPTGTLWVQLGAMANTREILDESVTAVSVCRGYRSVNYTTQDQGVICLYIKNGVAYYRQLTYREETGDSRWTEVTAVPNITGTVTGVQVHRLNDYRVGFLITTNTENIWLISERTYINAAYRPEQVSLYPKLADISIWIGSETTPLELLSCVLSADKMHIIATFNHPIMVRGEERTFLDYLNIPSSFINSGNEIIAITILNNVIDIEVKNMLRSVYTFTTKYDIDLRYAADNKDHWMNVLSSFTLAYEVIWDPIYVRNQDLGTLNINVTSFKADVKYIQIVNRHIPVPENVNLDLDLAASIKYIQVAPNNVKTEDSVNLAPILVANIQYIHVGDQPI